MQKAAGMVGQVQDLMRAITRMLGGASFSIAWRCEIASVSSRAGLSGPNRGLRVERTHAADRRGQPTQLPGTADDR